MRHHVLRGIAACSAVAASALAVAWLIRSSVHPDSPPLFAVAAFLFAVATAAAGFALCVLTVRGVMRASRDATQSRDFRS